MAIKIGIFLEVFAKKLLRVFWHSYLYMLGHNTMKDHMIPRHELESNFPCWISWSLEEIVCSEPSRNGSCAYVFYLSQWVVKQLIILPKFPEESTNVYVERQDLKERVLAIAIFITTLMVLIHNGKQIFLHRRQLLLALLLRVKTFMVGYSYSLIAIYHFLLLNEKQRELMLICKVCPGILLSQWPINW